MTRIFLLALSAWVATFIFSSVAFAAGTLSPAQTSADPIRILDHHVEVTINNGFARIEVTQLFENPNTEDLECIYTLPLPLEAALAEMTVETAVETLYGEVVSRALAEEIYQERRAAGMSVGVGRKENYQNFEFRITPVPAGGRVTMTFAYYQPVEIDGGTGRLLYPLEEGGTADFAPTPNDAVDGTFSANVTIHSIWPVQAVRVPGHAPALTQNSSFEWAASLTSSADLQEDLVLYYDLVLDKAAEVEMVYHRADAESQGTFMAVLTPGTELREIAGSDHVFLLDVSGSMEGKLETLKSAVVEAIGTLSQYDRFRVFAFSDAANEVTSGWIIGASSDVDDAVDAVRGLRTRGGTNVGAGLALGLADLSSEHSAAIYLITDGVANVGIVDGPEFVSLLDRTDARIFGFLLGNSGNWPLLELLTRTTGGFYSQVSNASDIGAEVMRARNRMTHEAMHGFSATFSRGGVTDQTPMPGVVHFGEQVVFFGHYDDSGPATLTIRSAVSGSPRTYAHELEFPVVATDYPELERMWALGRTRWLEYGSSMGLIAASEVQDEMREVGLEYQIVTDETSMILLPESVFEEYGIDRNNRKRTLTEEQARMQRERASGGGNERSENGYRAPSGGTGGGSGGGGGAGSYDDSYGGGAVEWTDTLWLFGLLGLLFWRRKRGDLPA